MQLKVVRFVSRCACGLAAILGITLCGSSALGQSTLLWDWSTSGEGGTFVDGSGTWDNTTSSWWDMGNNWARVPWTDGNNALIGWGGTAGTIALSPGLTVNVDNMTFGSVTGAYTITGGMIGVASITMNNPATIDSTLATGFTLGGGFPAHAHRQQRLRGRHEHQQRRLGHRFRGRRFAQQHLLRQRQLALRQRVTAVAIGGLSGGNGGVSLTSSDGLPVALTVGGNNATPQQFNGTISGSGSLIKTGAGMLILSGYNTFTGDVTISQGTIQSFGGGGSNPVVSPLGNPQIAHNVNVGPGAVLQFTQGNSLGDYTSTAPLVTINVNGGVVNGSNCYTLLGPSCSAPAHSTAAALTATGG